MSWTCVTPYGAEVIKRMTVGLATFPHDVRRALRYAGFDYDALDYAHREYLSIARKRAKEWLA